jgi:alcohol dehydrogenase class IV
LLRESSRAKNENYDLTLLTGTEGDGNIPHGALLVAFTDAVVKYDEAAAAKLRAEIREKAGDAALVDAAAIVAAFSGFDRIADSTGIPLEDAKAENSADFRASLGINAFAERKGEIADPRDRRPSA